MLPVSKSLSSILGTNSGASRLNRFSPAVTLMDQAKTSSLETLGWIVADAV